MINEQIFTELLPYPDREDRKIWIYVPEHSEGEKLPVVYMTDGQNLFDELPASFGSWGVSAAVKNEQKNGAGGAVIVGIDNGNALRDCELTPDCIGEVRLRELLCENFKPEGEIFDDFMMNTVIPFVEAHYPVKTDRKNVAVCGSSSGGLMAFFAGVEHSEKFSIIGAFSPAFLCYAQDDWRKYLMKKVAADMPYLYIYTGRGDELEQMIFESVETMYDLLPETGWQYDRMNEIALLENKHNEAAWREVFPDFLHTFLTR